MHSYPTKMLYLYLVVFLAAFVTASKPEKCSPVNRVIPEGEDYNTTKIELCSTDSSTSFHWWTKPIRGIIDKWLGRKHLTPNESDALREEPWSILNLPSYANYTVPDPENYVDGGWKVRIHGNLYKRRLLADNEVNNLVNRVLIRASVTKSKVLYKIWFDKLDAAEAKQARRQIRELATAGIGKGVIGVDMCNANYTSVLPYLTNGEGAFEDLLPLNYTCNTSPDDPYTFGPDHDIASQIWSKSASLKPLNVDGGRQNESRETQDMFFVPPRGLTIVSDVDDILRVGEVWN